MSHVETLRLSVEASAAVVVSFDSPWALRRVLRRGEDDDVVAADFVDAGVGAVGILVFNDLVYGDVEFDWDLRLVP